MLIQVKLNKVHQSLQTNMKNLQLGMMGVELGQGQAMMGVGLVEAANKRIYYLKLQQYFNFKKY